MMGTINYQRVYILGYDLNDIIMPAGDDVEINQDDVLLLLDSMILDFP